MKHNNQVNVSGDRLEAVKEFVDLLFTTKIDYNIKELGSIIITDPDTDKIVVMIDCDEQRVSIETGIAVLGRMEFSYDEFHGILRGALDRINATYTDT